jgi:hypothetical protein
MTAGRRAGDGARTAGSRTQTGCAAAAASALLVVACGSAATGQDPAAQPVQPAPSPQPGRSASRATGAARRRAAARYLAIARPAYRRLDHDLDDGLEGDDRDNLAASQADLRAAATERRFDRQLLALPLAALMAGTVAGFVLARTAGIFGFHLTFSSALAYRALIVEAVAVVFLLSTAAVESRR